MLLIALELVGSLATLLLELRGAHDGMLGLLQLAAHPRELPVALLQLPPHLRNLLVVATAAAAATAEGRRRLLRLRAGKLALSLERALVLLSSLLSLLNRAVDVALGVHVVPVQVLVVVHRRHLVRLLVLVRRVELRVRHARVLVDFAGVLAVEVRHQHLRGARLRGLVRVRAELRLRAARDRGTDVIDFALAVALAHAPVLARHHRGGNH